MHWIGTVDHVPVAVRVSIPFALMAAVTLLSMKLYDAYERSLNLKIAAALLRLRAQPRVAVT